MRYLNNGHTLCLHYRASEVGDSKQYWLEPASRSVGSWTVERALELGLIKPNGGGLFADGASQTYSAITITSDAPNDILVPRSPNEIRRLKSEMDEIIRNASS